MDVLSSLSRLLPPGLFQIIPPWLFFGLLLGVGASLLVAVVFVFGSRLFPNPTPGGPRVDGSLRRHAELRRYLTAIDEPFIEEYTHGEFTIAFYLPDRDVAITFDPRVFFGLDSTETFVILCEDEMPVAQLGSRLPFDVPTDTRAPTGTGSVDLALVAAYDELGLQPGASPEDVRRAYRERAKETHPDRGGSSAAFKQLQAAYTTVKDHTDGSNPQ